MHVWPVCDHDFCMQKLLLYVTYMYMYLLKWIIKCEILPVCVGGLCFICDYLTCLRCDYLICLSELWLFHLFVWAVIISLVCLTSDYLTYLSEVWLSHLFVWSGEGTAGQVTSMGSHRSFLSRWVIIQT